MLRKIAVGAGLMLVAACAPYKVPPTPVPPGNWVSPSVAGEYDERWWQVYGDPVLNALVDQALQGNLEVAVATQRIAVARARLRQAVAAARPGLSTDGSGSRQRGLGSSNIASDDPAAAFFTPDLDQWEIGVGASWEPDLFGGARLKRQAGRHEVGATEAEAAAVRLAIAGGVVRGYLQLRALQAQTQATKDALELAKEAARLTQLRFQLGDVRRIDVVSLSADVEALEASLKQLTTGARETGFALDTLIAANPGTSNFRLAAIQPLPQSHQLPAAGLPLDLLARRPDLIAAGYRAQSSRLLASAARRDALPSVTLGLFLGRVGFDQGGFGFVSNVARATGAFAWRGLDIGRTRADLLLADAEADLAFVDYRRVFRTALEDVERALSRIEGARQRLTHEEAALTARRRALELAEAGFRLGDFNRLQLIDAHRGLLDASIQRIETIRSIGDAEADLAVALGGGYLKDATERP